MKARSLASSIAKPPQLCVLVGSTHVFKHRSLGKELHAAEDAVVQRSVQLREEDTLNVPVVVRVSLFVLLEGLIVSVELVATFTFVLLVAVELVHDVAHPLRLRGSVDQSVR